MERMYFIGVSTGGSSIMRLFPRWAQDLELDAEIVGIDLPVGSDRNGIREAVTRIIDDPAARGGLVTTHKVAVGEEAGDLFVSMDGWAGTLREVSCIVKRDDGLHGSAKDPGTAWRAFVDIVGESHFALHPQAEVLCLGAGGSGTAFTSLMHTVDHPPARIHITDRSPDRLDFVASVHAELDSAVEVIYHRVSEGQDNDRVLESLPPRSVVANATGMGKDRPGSPLSDGAAFPVEGVAWEFNYRGSLEFLRQAKSQQERRRLRVADGWRYFLYGWSEHIADVFGLSPDPRRFERLVAVADDLKPASRRLAD